MTDQAQPTYIDVYGSADQFLLRTTMPVLSAMLNLHKSAVRRVEDDMAQPGGISQIHFNGKPNCLGQSHIMVQLAIGPRANY
jgi:hypothetical protein